MATPSNTTGGNQERFSFGAMALSDEPGRGGRGVAATAGDSAPIGEDDITGLNEAIDIMRMVSINEEFSPEILQYHDDAAQVIRTLVEEQTKLVDEEEDTEEEGISFESQLKRMELDRVNYLLRQYFRVRIKKIEKTVLYITKDKDSGVYDRLSPAEQTFALGYLDLVEDHFKKSFLSMLPEKVGVLDKDGNVDHATGPNLDKFVFCRVKNPVGRFAVGQAASDDALDFNPGDIICVRYRSIKELLEREDVELI